MWHLTIKTGKDFQNAEVSLRTKALTHRVIPCLKPWVSFHLRWNCFAPRKRSIHHTNRTLEVHCLLKQLPELALLIWVLTERIWFTEVSWYVRTIIKKIRYQGSLENWRTTAEVSCNSREIKMNGVKILQKKKILDTHYLGFMIQRVILGLVINIGWLEQKIIVQHWHMLGYFQTEYQYLLTLLSTQDYFSQFSHLCLTRDQFSISSLSHSDANNFLILPISLTVFLLPLFISCTNFYHFWSLSYTFCY